MASLQKRIRPDGKNAPLNLVTGICDLCTCARAKKVIRESTLTHCIYMIYLEMEKREGIV